MSLDNFASNASLVCFIMFFSSSGYMLVKVGLRDFTAKDIYIIIYPLFVVKFILKEDMFKGMIVASLNIFSLIFWIIFSFFI